MLVYAQAEKVKMGPVDGRASWKYNESIPKGDRYESYRPESSPRDRLPSYPSYDQRMHASSPSGDRDREYLRRAPSSPAAGRDYADRDRKRRRSIESSSPNRPPRIYANKTWTASNFKATQQNKLLSPKSNGGEQTVNENNEYLTNNSAAGEEGPHELPLSAQQTTTPKSNKPNNGDKSSFHFTIRPKVGPDSTSAQSGSSADNSSGSAASKPFTQLRIRTDVEEVQSSPQQTPKPSNTAEPHSALKRSFAPVAKMGSGQGGTGAAASSAQRSSNTAPTAAKSSNAPSSPNGTNHPPTPSISRKSSHQPSRPQTPGPEGTDPHDASPAPTGVHDASIREFVSSLVALMQSSSEVSAYESKVVRRKAEAKINPRPEELVKSQSDLSKAKAKFQGYEENGLRALKAILSNELKAIPASQHEGEAGISSVRDALEKTSRSNDEQITALKGEIERLNKSRNADLQSLKSDLNRLAKTKDSEIASLRSELEKQSKEFALELKELKSRSVTDGYDIFKRRTEHDLKILKPTSLQVSNIQSNVDGLHSDFKKLESSMGQILSQTDSFRTTEAKYDSEKGKTQAQIRRLEEKIKVLGEGASASPSNQPSTEKLRQVEEDVQQIRDSLKKLSEIVTTSREELSRKDSTLSSFSDRIQSANSDVQSLIGKQTVLEGTVKHLQEQASTKDSNLRDDSERVASLQAKLNALESDHDQRIQSTISLQSFTEHLSKKMEEIENRILDTSSYRKDINTIQATTALARQDLSILKEVVESLKTKSRDNTPRLPSTSINHQGSMRHSPAAQSPASSHILPHIGTPTGETQPGTPQLGWQQPRNKASSTPDLSGRAHLQDLPTRIEAINQVLKTHENFIKSHEERFNAWSTKTIYDGMVNAMQRMYHYPETVVRELAHFRNQIDIVAGRLNSFDRIPPVLEDIKQKVEHLATRSSASSGNLKEVEELKTNYKHDFETFGQNLLKARSKFDEQLQTIDSRVGAVEKQLPELVAKDKSKTAENRDDTRGSEAFQDVRSSIKLLQEQIANTEGKQELRTTLKSLQEEMGKFQETQTAYNEKLEKLSKEFQSSMTTLGPEFDNIISDVETLKLHLGLEEIKTDEFPDLQSRGHSRQASYQSGSGYGEAEDAVRSTPSKKRKLTHQRRQTRVIRDGSDDEEDATYAPKRKPR